MTTQKNALLRKYHTLLRLGGVTEDEKMAMLAAYGVESGKDLTVYELTELCGKLDRIANPGANENDMWRKRVIAAVFGYLRALGKKGSIEEAKAIACRAAKTEEFNRIPKERLKSLYNAFKNRENDLKEIDKMTGELLMSTSIYRATMGDA